MKDLGPWVKLFPLLNLGSDNIIDVELRQERIAKKLHQSKR